MIRFYDSKGEQHPLSRNDVENFYLLHETDGSIRLCFDISPENRFYSQLVEESELEYGDNYYIVKKVKNGKIECDLNFDFLKRNIHKNYAAESVLLMELLYNHLPDGWTVVNGDVSGIRRTTAFEFCTDYDIIMSSMETYGVYLEWSIKRKTVKVYLQSEAENTGEYLTDQLNLRKLSMQGDSLSLITRLYAYGKDGLSFASINGGKEYVDNTDYADKIVCGWWVDERYTVKSSLLEATKEKLKTLSYPARAYECDVVDLAKLNPKYSFLHFKLHKAVMLLDREHGIKVQHRIVRYKEYPYEPDRNVVTLSSVPQKISTRVNNLASSLEENKNLTNAYQKASVALSELISNSLGVYYTEVKDETGASHYYLHDQPLLETSSTIYTHNAGGYAFTNSGWNNGNPDWQYGFTKDGNAVFNKVCAYGLKVSDPWGDFSAEVSPNAFKIWQDGILKLDASYNGLNIYDGAITIYKGAGAASKRALYFDSDGNIALDGYLTQFGSSHRALVGANEFGYSGFYLYNHNSNYLRANGTYKPYFDVWIDTDNETFVGGTNALLFGVSTIDNEDDGNYPQIKLVPGEGTLYGTWNINGALNIYNTVKVHNNMLQFWYNNGAAESGFIGTGMWGEKNILLLKSDGVPLYMTYADNSGNDGAHIVLDGNKGTLYGAFNFNQDQTFSVDIEAHAFQTSSISIYNSTSNSPCIFSRNRNPILIGVSDSTRIMATSSGGVLYGAWDFDQNQKFTKDIATTAALQLYNGSTLIFNMYHSTSNNPCLKSENDKDILFIVGGNTRMEVKSTGGALIGNWYVVDTNGYYRINTTTSGGTLYGDWDFDQEQFFSHTINAPAFICRSGSSKVMSLYISTGNNPCFNSDNGKDIFFSVGGTSRLVVRSTGGDMYGAWQINTDSGYVSLITDKTGTGGGKLWGTWYLGNSTAITSDVNKKNTIEDLSEKYSVLFDNLRPIRYKYNDGTSDRYHTGFIAQEVEQALTISEVDSSEFAGFVRTKDDECFLRYEEFIALAVKEIQSLKRQNTELERKLNSVLEKMEV